jgi:TPR repeat protein
MSSHYLSLKHDVKNRDPRKGIPWLEKGCKLQDGRSCFNLAVLYKKGDSTVAPDMKKHHEYREKAEALKDNIFAEKIA